MKINGYEVEVWDSCAECRTVTVRGCDICFQYEGTCKCADPAWLELCYSCDGIGDEQVAV